MKLGSASIPTGFVSSTGDGRFDLDNSGAFEPFFGTDNNVDNDDDGSGMGAMVVSDTIRLTLDDEPQGNVNPTVDFGLYLPLEFASVGDLIWFDTNHDGQKDLEENGVPNVQLQLFGLGQDGQKGTMDDSLIGTEETNSFGIYSFTGVEPGDYYVMIDLSTLPANFTITSQNQGADATDNDFNEMGMTAIFSLGSGENNTTIDGGIDPDLAAIGDFVWFDDNFDGILDTAVEAGVPNVLVRLFGLGNDGQKGGGDDIELASVFTNNGFYLSLIHI